MATLASWAGLCSLMLSHAAEGKVSLLSPLTLFSSYVLVSPKLSCTRGIGFHQLCFSFWAWSILCTGELSWPNLTVRSVSEMSGGEELWLQEGVCFSRWITGLAVLVGSALGVWWLHLTNQEQHVSISKSSTVSSSSGAWSCSAWEGFDTY